MEFEFPYQRCFSYIFLLQKYLKNLPAETSEHSKAWSLFATLQSLSKEVDPKIKEIQTIHDKWRSSDLLIGKQKEDDLNKLLEKPEMVKNLLGKKSNKLKISVKNVEILQRIKCHESGVGKMYSVEVTGWHCCMKEIGQQDDVDFDREISILEDLPYHNNVVKYLFHEHSGKNLQIFMSYFPSNLYALLNQRKLTEQEIVLCSLDIAKGLEFLHSHNIVHRNIKSDNIWVSFGDENSIKRVAIGNFDSAKDVTKSAAKTVIDHSCYAAPEVWTATKTGAYTFKADVWSFGLVIYEMLAGNRPYASERNSVSLILAGTRPTLKLEAPTPIAVGLSGLFEACTSLDPKQRPSVMDIKKKLFELIG
eukprot:TRINITY_DN12629_c0_g1_i1.p1 TRINITY_DN12629_c0_g1~~TRINITY_DN12629_c0_g1_i1.p1  ORF type:complete len:363 (+),score=95.46 TRINITY_DN12629_c0_g1_i1:265-1353(+)